MKTFLPVLAGIVMIIGLVFIFSGSDSDTVNAPDEPSNDGDSTEPKAGTDKPVVPATDNTAKSKTEPTKPVIKEEVQKTSGAVALDVLERATGQKLKNISFKDMKQVDGRDVYKYECVGGKLVISGSSVVARCRAFYDYIRANKMGMIGWEGARLKLPKAWPYQTSKYVETPYKIRHCYNVVTFGYTTPYWTWERWEQELDWLAIHGFNMIMAPVATEAIATRVWRKLGLTPDEINKFYVGPAHLPWQRMGNIRSVGGTLTPEWHKDQVALQKKILARMRLLGIEPVVQSFAGFVPSAIKRIYPEIKLHATSWNAGFGHAQRPVVVMPDTPEFKTICKMYIDQWHKEFGEAKYFLVDSFNEMELPNTGRPKTELLADYGKMTYDAINNADPNAVWVIQGWMFSYQRHIWKHDTVKALLSKVPDERMLILDYANDYNNNYKPFGAFFGKPWVFGYVPNMGGKTAYTGNMSFYAKAPADMLKDPNRKNISGFTISGEGLENNQVLYELMSDTSWRTKEINLDRWLKFYSENRYGGYTDSMKTAWDLLRQTCYRYLTPHPTFAWQNMRTGHGSVNREPKFTEGVKSFLQDRDKFKNSLSYRDDALEMVAISLSLKVDEWFALASTAYNQGARKLGDQAVERGLEMLLEVDRLMESHSLNRLDRWLALARQHSEDVTIQNKHEHNARQIVTVWGPPVNDYSCRMWSGLIRDFYQPRMKKYFENLSQGTRFNRRAWESAWVKSEGISKVEPYADPVTKAAELLEQAYAEPLPTPPELNEAGTIVQWSPAMITGKWQTVEWPLTVEQLHSMTGLKFIYKKGRHRLDVKDVEIIADGKVVASDKHFGYAGVPNSRNIYIVEIPDDVTANNGCSIRAVVRGGGGNDSFGNVILLEE